MTLLSPIAMYMTLFASIMSFPFLNKRMRLFSRIYSSKLPESELTKILFSIHLFDGFCLQQFFLFLRRPYLIDRAGYAFVNR